MGAIFLCSKSIGLRLLRVATQLDRSSVEAVLTIDDHTDGRSVLTQIQAWCEQHQIPLAVCGSRAEADQQLGPRPLDLVVVAGWYWLISPDLLARARRGFIGFHHSLLPRYRGGAPLVWALIEGEPRVGSSLFYLSTGIDDGDLVDQIELSVSEDEAIGQVLDRLERAQDEVFRSRFRALLDGTAPRRAQPAEGATWCGQRKPEDGLIDWRWEALRVARFVRAQSSPYPGAFCFLDGLSLRLEQAHPFTGRYLGTPGQVLEIKGPAVLVSCGGSTALWVDKVRQGGSSVDASLVIRSLKARLDSTPSSGRERE